MASELSKLKARLSALNISLDELEEQLGPLFSKALPETLLGLDIIQQAKLQVVIPYILYDLVFIYLKSRGIDPKSHPVVAELDRVRQYFDKIKDAEKSQETQRLGVDKAAANRFIKHAIAQLKSDRPSGELSERSNEPPTDVCVPVKITSKMAARAEYEQNLKDLGSEEEESLEVFDEVPAKPSTGGEPMHEDRDLSGAAEVPSSKSRGKQRAVDEEIPGDTQGTKRRRARIDPFAGYGDDVNTPSAEPITDRPKKSKVLTPDNVVSANVQSQQDETVRSATTDSILDSKRQAKAAKKAKRKAKQSAS